MAIRHFLANRKVLILVFSFFLLSPNYLTASQNRSFTTTIDSSVLLYQIELAKDSFLLHEPVRVELWLKNTSDRAVIPKFRLFSGWGVQDSSGKLYPASVPEGYRASTTLNPGDSNGGVISLDQYGIPYELNKFDTRYFPEGRYSLSYWRFGDSIPPLIFTVVKPQGDEVEALELYLKSFPDVKGENVVKLPREEFKKHYKERMTALMQVVDSYPNSAYAEASLSLAASFAWIVLKDKELSHRLYLRLLNEYSDPNGYALKLVENYYVNKKDSKGFRGDLENIIKNSSDTNVVVRAKRRLKELDSEMW